MLDYMQTHPESSHSPLAYLTTIDSNHRFDNCSFGGNSTARLRRGRITIKLITLPPGSERERERAGLGSPGGIGDATDDGGGKEGFSLSFCRRRQPRR